MNVRYIAILLGALIGLQVADAQSSPPIGSDVIVTLTGSGFETESFTYADGRVDEVSNQVTIDLTLHPSPPQVSGFFFSSIAADFSGTIDLNVNITSTDGGNSTTDQLQNQINYTESNFGVSTSFFGPQFVGVDPGDVASLSLDPPTSGSANPEVYQLAYDGTNNTVTLWISLPFPFENDNDTCTIPCTALVTGNGSSFSGVVEDASTGLPIPNPSVIIAGQTVPTGSDGSFSVPYLVPGPLSVEVSAPNYTSYKNTEPLAPFSTVSVTFKLKPAASQLTIFDANPLFLSSTILPQPITPALLKTLASASESRGMATADGFTQLLLEFTNDTPGTVIFSMDGDGTLTAIDGSQLPASGVSTTLVEGEQMAFALYKVPDQIAYDRVTFYTDFAPTDTSKPSQQSEAAVTLVQTPVLLVHGLWANSSVWQDMQSLLTVYKIPSQRLNYFDNTLYAAGPFVAYRGLINQTIQSMLNGLRGGGTATTCADVVAHSMGGILTRIDASDAASHRIDNYSNGYIRRVVTVDTPHFGSSAAPILSLLANDIPVFGVILAKSGHPVNSGAVQDLSPLSFAVNSGGASGGAYQPLSLPCYAIGGQALSNGDISDPVKALYLASFLNSAILEVVNPSQYNLLTTLLCGQQFSADEGALGMAEEIFFGQPNDAIVAVYSQDGDNVVSSNYSGIEHTLAPLNTAMQMDVLGLLQGPVSAFSQSGFPPVSQHDLDTQICPSLIPAAKRLTPGPSGKHPSPPPSPQIVTPLITLTSPSNGVTVFPGSNLGVTAQPLPNVTLQFVVFLASAATPSYNENAAWDTVTNAPFTVEIAAPTNFFGPMVVTAIAVDDQGNYDIEQRTVQILPGASLTLESISVNLNSIGTNLVFSQLGQSQALSVNGAYSDGTVRDITLAGANTTYSTSDPSVAVVDTNGNVSAVSNGAARITVMNGALIAQVPVQVNLQPPQIWSIQPDNLLAGSSNFTVSITGMNLGETTNIMFLRSGQPETNVIVETMVFGVNAANIQVQISVASDAEPGLLTVVATTPVGSSAQTPVQGNQFLINQALVINNLGFTNGASGGRFAFTVVGSAGSNFIIQTSTDLLNWVNEITNTLASGSFNFIETNPPASAQYYRVELHP